jgi:cysteine desulfurase / selenocysteine lyase
VIRQRGANYIAFLQVARKTGAKVEPVSNDERGQLSVEALCEMVDERVKLIAITHVPTNGGLVNPAAAVGEVARKAGVLYLLDAC